MPQMVPVSPNNWSASACSIPHHSNQRLRPERRDGPKKWSQGRDGPTGVSRLAPGPGHPINGDLLNVGGVAWNLDVRLATRFGREGAGGTWVVRWTARRTATASPCASDETPDIAS